MTNESEQGIDKLIEPFGELKEPMRAILETIKKWIEDKK